MTKQQVILVDRNNKKIGLEEKIKAHQKGLLHRAFSIFIFNSNRELLLQQRAKTKYHSGKLWSNTVCSHPQPNEAYKQAAQRRLKEEMGFSCKLKKLFCFTYQVSFDNGLHENEYDCIFIGQFNGAVKPNKEEVMAYQWISIENLKQDILSQPHKYTAWLKIALPKLKLRKLMS